MVKFNFSFSKLRKRPFLIKFNKKMSNFKTQGSLALLPALSTPMAGEEAVQ